MGRKRKEGKRPNCPRCGKPDPLDFTIKWKCRYCGRTWVKVRAVRKTPNNPPCRFCGGPTTSNGLNYICKVCGKANRKVFVYKRIASIQELCMAKIIKI